MVIKTINNLYETAPKTFLGYPESVGTSVIRWKSANGLGASWAVQIGEVGEAQSEIAILSSGAPSGTLGTLTANTAYSHSADTPIYGIKYNQIVFEKSSAGTAGTATPITDGTITIQPNSQYTIFDDTNGTTSDAWRTYYRNSVLAVNSTESDWITTGGFNFYSLAKIRERVKEKLWKPDYLTDDTIDNWINEWQEKMRNTAVSVNQDYAIGTANVAFGTNGLGTITSTNYKDLRRVDVTYNGTDYYLAGKIPSNQYQTDQVFDTSTPKINMVGENVFQVNPSSTAGTAKIAFYSLVTPLVNDTDEIPVSMRGYTSSFVNYPYSQALFKDQKFEEGAAILSLAKEEKDRFKTELSPRGKLGIDYIRYVEPLSAEEGFS